MLTMLTRSTPLLLVAALLSACATTSGGAGARSSGKGVGPEVRAVERWNLLIERKAELAYDYLSPGKRATEKREDYATAMNNRPVRWQKVTLYGKTCPKEDTCTITLQVDVSVPLMGNAGSAASLGFPEETWIRGTDGVWYYLGPTPKQAGQ